MTGHAGSQNSNIKFRDAMYHVVGAGFEMLDVFVFKPM
jgi:hypothetical protein